MIRRKTGLVLLLGAGFIALAWTLVRAPGRGATGVPSAARSAPDEPEPLALTALQTPAASGRRLSPRDEQLARGIAVEGRVLYPAGMPPAQRAFVVARGKPFADGGHDEVEVSADGSFRCVFAPGTRSGSLELHGAFLLAEPIPWRTGLVDPLVFRPTLGARLRGTLASSAGLRPTPGDEVELVEPRPMHDSSPSLRLRAAVSASGEFEFPALPELEFAYLVYKGAELLGECTVGPFSAGSSQTAELPVKLGVVLAGRVVVAPDAGLGGVLVMAKRTTPPERSARETTDSAGRFRFAALEPGEWELKVRTEGYLLTTLAVSALEPGARHEDLELMLARGGSLAGRLLWTDGTPIEGRVEVVGDGPRDVHFVRSDADGRFELTGLAAQHYRVRAEASRREKVLPAPDTEPLERSTRLLAQLEDVPVGARELELRFRLGLTLDGRVLDEDGVPVERATLHVVPARPESIVPGLPFSLLRVRDPLGRFQLAGLAPGSWRLQASASEFEDSLPMEVEVPTSAPVELVLRSMVRLAGRVLDAQGNPVGGAELELETQGASESERSYSEPDGGFMFEQVAPYLGRLRALAPGHAPSDWRVVELTRDRPPELELRLNPAGRIEGLAVDTSGTPLAKKYVTLRGRNVELEQKAWTGSDGRVQFAGLAAGEYEIQARLLDTPVRERVVVESGSVVQVQLVAPSAPVRVLGVLRFDGVPVSQATLTCSGVRATTDSRGEFTLLLPRPGQHTLLIAQRAEANEISFAWPIEVAEEATAHLEVSCTLAYLRGRVSMGESVAGRAHIEARGDGLLLSSWARCDEEGRYDLGVLAGESRLTAIGPHDASYASASTSVRVGPGQVLEGVDFLLSPGGLVHGKVQSESGAPLGGISVACASPGERRWAVSDSHGHFELRGLSAGNWQVSAVGKGLALRAPAVVTCVAGELRKLDLTLVQAATLEVRQAQEAFLPSTLTLLDASGQVLEGPLDFDTSALLGPLADGHYQVRLECASERREQAFHLVGGRSVVLTLDSF